MGPCSMSLTWDLRGAYLEFVLARLGLRGWVEEVDGENLGWG